MQKRPNKSEFRSEKLAFIFFLVGWKTQTKPRAYRLFVFVIFFLKSTSPSLCCSKIIPQQIWYHSSALPTMRSTFISLLHQNKDRIQREREREGANLSFFSPALVLWMDSSALISPGWAGERIDGHRQIDGQAYFWLPLWHPLGHFCLRTLTDVLWSRAVGITR